ncbi:nucleotidyltransferase domain-containing protein [Marinicella rhabdoformis]|uniref:nucleotidyltransferase domain-containing protein n=1 Tax=Marinicella rhabdoformis TaxID=2580566 RepID=UPI0012AEC8A7|nr:nucleotidyltransferase domain-containing protein [Marinicella rhabdoformis]
MENEIKIKDSVLAELKAIEAAHDVIVIHAIESGSRSWGFPSPDSDYDVRFIYVHKKDWYLQVHPERDVIEVPISDELDIAGWDLKKAMQLAAKGNVVVHEWLNTPIVYQSHENLYEKMMKVMDLSFKPQAAYYHYRSMAKSAWKDIKGQNEVKLKRFFYFMRSLLSARWILQKNTMPSVEFGYLIAHTGFSADMADKVKDLVTIKSGLNESECTVIDADLLAYVETLFVALEDNFPQGAKQVEIDWNHEFRLFLKCG